MNWMSLLNADNATTQNQFHAVFGIDMWRVEEKSKFSSDLRSYGANDETVTPRPYSSRRARGTQHRRRLARL